METQKKPRGARRASGRLCTFYLSTDSDVKVKKLSETFGSRSKAVSMAIAITEKLMQEGLITSEKVTIPAYRIEVITHEIKG